MDTQTITQKLDTLADLRSQIDAINLHYNDLKAQVIPAEILAKLEEIEAERASSLEAAQYGLTSLEQEIKDAVIVQGESVKGTCLMAVYNKGRVSWDSKLLEGLAIALPQVMEARKEGQPYISFRNI